MAPKKAPERRPEILTSEKVMQTFRMPRDLVARLKMEAQTRGLDLTALLVRVLHGYLTYFGLPYAAAAHLEDDREALRLDMDAYLAHLLYQRSIEVREHGAGFDAPEREKKGR